MSTRSKKSSHDEDLSSVEEDTIGSSISLSVGENSIRIKDKNKGIGEPEPLPVDKINLVNKWWLKSSVEKVKASLINEVQAKGKQSPTPSPDVSSSMKDFLEKEKMCKVLQKDEGVERDRDDTLCDVLASVAFEKYPSDFENATDDDIGSILEEMSKIAIALSPNSVPDNTKSGSSSKHPTEEEKSVEELLKEAEKLVRKNSTSLSKGMSRSETLVPDNESEANESLGRARQLEEEIFQLIEEEVHKESEKIKRSPKNEKKRDESPGCEIIYENLNVLCPPKTLELQRRKFEEQKIEISSSSDLDDPIERHSKSEELKTSKKAEESKENLQKEITDVDKNFFEDLLKRSKDKPEGPMSGSSSFGQEDFSHFLKLLQGHTEKMDHEQNNQNPVPNDSLFREMIDMGGSCKNEKSPEFPEKEISEILEKELLQGHSLMMHRDPSKTDAKLSAEKFPEFRYLGKEEVLSLRHFKERKTNEHASSTDTHSSPKHIEGPHDIKKVVNSRNELYTVGLTPRLELFADSIPKLLAEKSKESMAQSSTEKLDATTENVSKPERSTVETSKPKVANEKNLASKKSYMSKSDLAYPSNISKYVEEALKIDRIGIAPDNKDRKKEIRFCKSKSYDQICKPLRTGTDNVRAAKPLETSKRPPNHILKRLSTSKPKEQIKLAPKLLPKNKLPIKARRDAPLRETSVSNLLPSAKTSREKLSRESTTISMAGGDVKHTLTKQDWEALCREERHKNALLKEQLQSEAKQYKMRIDTMRTSFEQELFDLKKQNIILKAKVEELSLSEKQLEDRPRDTKRIELLERELEKQETLIRAYETENKKLLQEKKRNQEDMKNLQRKQKVPAIDQDKAQQLADTVKDLQEEKLKLKLEISQLRENNADYALKNDDLNQQNGLLSDELQMFKEQLQTKNDFITDRLQSMTTVELELRKQIDEITIKLNSKTEQLRTTRSELENLQRSVLPLEKELLEFRVKEENAQEKLRIAKSHVEREKQLSQRLKDQVILDNKKIMDLNRQVREMERILKRKNPDSVSALILTANSEQERISAEKVKLLEERIAMLESEIKTKEDIGQQKLLDLQNKFTDTRERYNAQIATLEEKLADAVMKERKVYVDAYAQTNHRLVESKSIETTKSDEKSPSFEKEEKKDAKATARVAQKPPPQNVKEDAHLIATIRGLKQELTNKDRTVSKLTKEYQELQKTNRRLQKEREKLLNDRRSFRSIDLDKFGKGTAQMDTRLTGSRTQEGSDKNSNVYQNGHATDTNSQRLTGSTQRLYDPMQYTENSDANTVKRLNDENEILKEELSKMNKDFMALKNKRLHDLNLLQEEHERELATLVKEYSVKFGDSKVVKLQSQVSAQMAIIARLKQQIDKLKDYKYQVVTVKTERDHLENKVRALNEKLKYLSTPGIEQLQLLQDKITILQQRHESREMTLQNLVRDLLRNRAHCKDCKNEKGKNRQLCYFRQELDHILGMLQEIANVH